MVFEDATARRVTVMTDAYGINRWCLFQCCVRDAFLL
jgi:hypothetical protein